METFTSTWQSPSNIALIKYWGKTGNQIPSNPSLSMTLNKSYSETTLNAIPTINNEKPSVQFTFQGKQNEEFARRINIFLRHIDKYLKFINNHNLIIESKNTFPHSSGIASSAAFMSSLSLCLCTIENKIHKSVGNVDEFFRVASFISRLGSGSATRSIYGGYVSWGVSGNVKHSSNEFATPLNDIIHDVFKDYCDSILIISSKKKKISSSDGHRLMNSNPYSNTRYPQASENFTNLLELLKAGDEEEFGKIVEHEAMSLHALMMLSSPWVLLFEQNTIAILNKIRDFRTSTGIKLYFTIDAGPNVHLIYNGKIKDKVLDFIDSELKGYCESQLVINDFIGNGPKQIN